MKYAIMSDVHANPRALETALADARAHKCEKFVFAGDVTGYGYDANVALRLVRETIDRFAAILDDHLRGVRTGERSGYSSRGEVNNSGWAVSTLNAALWAFETTTTFEDGMIAAVNLGGDADTIGAVYGQLAGAYYGFGAIPSRWVEKVKNTAIVKNEINRFLAKVGVS